MATHLLLNMLRLEADEAGFTILVNPVGEIRPTIVGEFSEPELIIGYKLRQSVIHAYAHQDGVNKVECYGNVDSVTDTAICLEVKFHLDPGVNWFELDHSKFNQVYCDDI